MATTPIKKYKLKLFCDNCLTTQTYEIPFGREFISWMRKYKHNWFKASVMVEYNSGYTDTEFRSMNCSNCGSTKLRR